MYDVFWIFCWKFARINADNGDVSGGDVCDNGDNNGDIGDDAAGADVDDDSWGAVAVKLWRRLRLSMWVNGMSEG